MNKEQKEAAELKAANDKAAADRKAIEDQAAADRRAEADRAEQEAQDAAAAKAKQDAAEATAAAKAKADAEAAAVPKDTGKNLYIRNTDKQKYALTIVPDDRLGRTHKCENQKSFWEGTLSQFLAQFDPETGKESRNPKPSRVKGAEVEAQ